MNVFSYKAKGILQMWLRSWDREIKLNCIGGSNVITSILYVSEAGELEKMQQWSRSQSDETAGFEDGVSGQESMNEGNL